jgi:hypothetical protein
MQLTRIRFTVRRLMVAVAIIAIAVGVGVLFLRPTTLAVSIKIVNKTAGPLGNLELNFRQQTGDMFSISVSEAIPPGETRIHQLAISGPSTTAFDFSCTDPGGKVISGQAMLNS